MSHLCDWFSIAHLSYYACTMPTIPVLCLLCLYYAYYACTMPIYNYRSILRFLGCNNTDFVEKVTKAFCILILLSTSKTISTSKTYFTSLANSLVSEIACRKTMLQLSADELQRIKKCCSVYGKQIYLYCCQPLLCAPHNNIAQAVDDAV